MNNMKFPVWRKLILVQYFCLFVTMNFTEMLLGTPMFQCDFLSLVFFIQVFNEINSREMGKINVFRDIFKSWMFIGIIVLTVAFQVIIVEFLGTFASTVPLSWQLWLLCIIIGAISMPLAVVIKFIPVKNNTPKLQHHDGYDLLPDLA